MKQIIVMAVAVFTLSVFVAFSALADPAKCPPDSVQVGPVCVDKYEASVWEIPATNPRGKSNKNFIKKVQKGEAILDDLTQGGALSSAAILTSGREGFVRRGK